MADSRCCFGCSNVRNGAWVISIFDMIICLLLALQTLLLLDLEPYSNSFKRTVRFGDYSFTDTYISQMQYDFIIFSRLSILFLFIYVNLNLKRTTYSHNTQSINHWLITNSIFFSFFILYVCFTTVKNSSTNFIPIAIPISIVAVYQIYVVKCFYDDELNFLATSERNATAQPYVAITSQTVQAPVYPVQAVQPPVYPIQTGPYIIQQVDHSATQTSYPQQTFQYASNQMSPELANVFSQPDIRAPQEYCNPPPYSPAYVEGGPSVKH